MLPPGLQNSHCVRRNNYRQRSRRAAAFSGRQRCSSCSSTGLFLANRCRLCRPPQYASFNVNHMLPASASRLRRLLPPGVAATCVRAVPPLDRLMEMLVPSVKPGLLSDNPLKGMWLNRLSVMGLQFYLPPRMDKAEILQQQPRLESQRLWQEITLANGTRKRKR